MRGEKKMLLPSISKADQVKEVNLPPPDVLTGPQILPSLVSDELLPGTTGPRAV